MATEEELNNFLASVEKKAFKQAVYSVQNDESALDIVQDSMLKLAQKYGDRPANEWPMIFQRILKNTITDYFRREKVKSTWISSIEDLSKTDNDETLDWLEAYVDENATSSNQPHDIVERQEILKIIEEAIKKLPERQREAFLMRYYYDMDVFETAQAMGCSEGSVKTHCSRATNALAKALKAKGIHL